MEFDDPMKQVRMEERAARFGLEKTPRQKLTLTINNFTVSSENTLFHGICFFRSLTRSAAGLLQYLTILAFYVFEICCYLEVH